MEYHVTLEGVVLFMLGVSNLCTAFLLYRHSKEIEALQMRLDKEES